MPPDGVRRAGLSAFGFGGTNFHAVLEEYIPNRLNGNGKRSVAVSEMPSKVEEPMLVTMMNVKMFPQILTLLSAKLRYAEHW